MFKAILIASLFSVASTGIWVTSTGEVQTVPCPESYDDTRERLPQGCVNLQPGVWLAPARYRDMEVEIAGLREQISGKDREIELLKARVNELQGQLIITTAVPDCPACSCSTLPHTLTGALIGTALTAGGCVLWTVSQ